jgi:hypothetical protein
MSDASISESSGGCVTPAKPICRYHARRAARSRYGARFNPSSPRHASIAPPLARQVAASAANSALVGGLPDAMRQPVMSGGEASALLVWVAVSAQAATVSKAKAARHFKVLSIIAGG